MLRVRLKRHNSEPGRDPERLFSTKIKPIYEILDGRRGELATRSQLWLQSLMERMDRHRDKILSAQSFLLKPITINGEVITWDTLQARFATPRALRLKDKMAFVIGVTNMCAMSLMLGMAPYLLPASYIVKLVALLAVRVLLYKRKRWHYYMFEMCYLVNVLFILALLVPFKTPTIFFSIWGLANGPMLSAVATMNNSLVFHSLDKITSLMIHFDAPLTLFALRWVIDYDEDNTKKYVSRHLYKIVTEYPKASIQSVIIPSIALYLIWQLLYWIFIWELQAEKIKSGHQTTLSRVIEDRGSFYHKATLLFGIRWQPLLFALLQLLYTIVLVPIAALMLNSMALHIASLVTAMFIATYSGANYYLEVLTNRNNNINHAVKCRKSKDD